MHITMVFVASLDGKITRQTEGPSSWASVEDQKLFATLIDESDLIVMGRKTFEAARSVIQLKPGKLRIILTKHPEKYVSEEVPGQLEFSSELPPKLVTRLSQKGYENMLVVGGNEVNWLFFQYKLVSRILMTLEPQIFGTGKNILSDALSFTSDSDEKPTLQLIKVDTLNEQGTLLLEYGVRF